MPQQQEGWEIYKDAPSPFPDAGQPKTPVQLRDQAKPREVLMTPLRPSATFHAATPPDPKAPFRAPGGPRDIPFIGATANDYIRRAVIDYEHTRLGKIVSPEAVAGTVGSGIGIAGGGALGIETGPGAIATAAAGGGVGGATGAGLFNQFMGRPNPPGQVVGNFALGVFQALGGEVLPAAAGKMLRFGGKMMTSGELFAGMFIEYLSELLMPGSGTLVKGAAKVGMASVVRLIEKMMSGEAYKALPPELQAYATRAFTKAAEMRGVKVAQNVAGQVVGRAGAQAAPSLVRGAEEVEKRVEPQDTTGPEHAWQWHYVKPNEAGGYVTPLTRPEERQFLQWAKENDIPFDSGSTSEYDLRGFWKAGAQFDRDAQGLPHYPERWKTPYSPSFNRKSIYATHEAPQLNDKGQVVDVLGRVLYDPAKNKPETKEPTEEPQPDRTPEPTPQATGPPSGSASDDVIFRLAGAIARHEGFYKEGSSAQRMNNPGAVQPGGQFPSYKGDEGWYALYDTIRKHYDPNETIQDFAQKYDDIDADNWAKDVAAILGVTPETKLSDLTNAANP